MIRNPSDGSVREPKEITHAPNENKALGRKATPEEINSGFASEPSDRLERLQKSREWLKRYQAGKGRVG